MLRVRRLVAPLALLLLFAACGGDGGATDPETDPTGTLALSISPSSASIEAGSSGSAVVTVTRGGGFDGSVSFTVEGVPSGVSAALSSATLAAGVSSANIDLLVDASVEAGTYTITVRANGNGVDAATATFSLTVTPAPPADFDVEVSQTTFTIEQGDSASASVLVERIGGFDGDVGLFVTGAPTDVRARVNPNTTADTIAELGIAVGIMVEPGTYPLVLTASENGPRERTVDLTLIVTAKPSSGTLTLSAANVPVTKTIPSDPIVVRLDRAQGVTGPAEFSIESFPIGFSGTFSPNPTTGDSTVLVLELSTLAPTGTNNVVVRVTVGETTSTTTLQVTSSTFVPPDFGLSIAPDVASVAAGTGTSVQVNIARTNFTDSVALAVVGLPAGMTATLTPPATDGAAATLDIATTVAVAPGVYPLTVEGTADGITGTRSATLLLTVNAPTGGGNIQWQFCDPARYPLWFGVRTGTSGAWTRVTSEASADGIAFTFALDQAGQVAMVLDGASGVDITVFNTTPQEVLGLAARECADNRPTKTISGRIVNGINGLRGASIVAGGTSTIIPAGGSNFTLTGVKEGTTDIIAYLGIPENGEFRRFDRIIMRRDIDPADGAVMADFDFAVDDDQEWLAATGANFTFRNLGGDMFTVTRSYLTANGNVGPIAFYQPRSDSVVGLYGVPEGFRRPGDLHQLVAATVNATAPRTVTGYNSNFNSSPLEFGPPLDAPTVTVASSSPVRIRAEGSWSGSYGSAVGVSFVQATADSRSLSMTASRDFFGASSTYELESPDFAGAPGFDANWLLRSGVATTHAVTATGIGQGVSITPADGTQIITGSRVGTITP